MILVIAEKPSVAQTIAAVLGAKEKKDGFLTGSGYIVSWCVGHLVGLAEAATYGEQYKKWSYDSLPILPQEWKYTVASDKEKQFKTLKELMHRADVSEVVNACDAGREGELIFRFVYEMAGCKKPMRRLWISSMEDSAIKEGFSRLKNGEEYDALFASALCRAKADWLIGINATRLFGYKKVPEFLQPENYLKTAEQTTEQNYNMIDGQINNTPTVAELEAKGFAQRAFNRLNLCNRHISASTPFISSMSSW